MDSTIIFSIITLIIIMVLIWYIWYSDAFVVIP